MLNQAIERLINLQQIFESAETKRKRKIIGSIFPEKIVFGGTHYRTARLNEAVLKIFNVGAGFCENKKGQNEINFDLSSLVPRRGIEPLIHP